MCGIIYREQKRAEVWLAPMREEGVFRREGIEKERGAKRGFMFFFRGFELLYGTVVKENESMSVMTQCARMMKKKKKKKKKKMMMIKIRRTRRGGKW